MLKEIFNNIHSNTAVSVTLVLRHHFVPVLSMSGMQSNKTRETILWPRTQQPNTEASSSSSSPHLCPAVLIGVATANHSSQFPPVSVSSSSPPPPPPPLFSLKHPLYLLLRRSRGGGRRRRRRRRRTKRGYGWGGGGGKKKQKNDDDSIDDEDDDDDDDDDDDYSPWSDLFLMM